MEIIKELRMLSALLFSKTEQKARLVLYNPEILHIFH